MRDCEAGRICGLGRRLQALEDPLANGERPREMAAAPPAAPAQTRTAPARTMTDADFEHVNGYSWDYCLCFAVLEDEQEATAFQREWSMRKIMQRIAAAGLEYKLFKGSTVEQKDQYRKILGANGSTPPSARLCVACSNPRICSRRRCSVRWKAGNTIGASSSRSAR